MREIHVDEIREVVKTLCIEATCLLPDDVVSAPVREADGRTPVAVRVLDQILVNADMARTDAAALPGYRHDGYLPRRRTGRTYSWRRSKR
jgi:tartrate dehydratase alpha subunit/fumarate hydratase class I-like protein